MYIKHIMEKVGVHDRTQAVAIAVKRGMIQLRGAQLAFQFERREIMIPPTPTSRPQKSSLFHRTLFSFKR